MFHGSIVALVTPMRASLDLDMRALHRLVDFHIENETDGIVVAGTTGESPTLTDAEFSRLVKRTVKRVNGRIPVIAGTGTADTGRTVARSQRAAELGADACLVVTPYYSRPMQTGLFHHFTTVADNTDIPVILYNVPSRTAVDLLPETVERLSFHPNIAGIKEAVSSMERVQELLQRCGDDFLVLSGDDPSCREAIRLGASGVISVAANAAPRHLAELCRAARNGDDARADQLNDQLQELFAQLSVETNPIPVKWAALKLGLVKAGIRLPLLPLESRYHSGLQHALENLGLLPTQE